MAHMRLATGLGRMQRLVFMAARFEPDHNAKQEQSPPDGDMQGDAPQVHHDEEENASDLSGVGDVVEPIVDEPTISRRPGAWWGTYQIAEDQQGRWQVGPLTLWLRHMPFEWRLALQNAPDDAFDPEQSVSVEAPSSYVEGDDLGLNWRRYGFRNSYNSVRLSPLLADRAVVTKTDQPLYIFAGEEVTIYVSFPLWVRVGIGEPSRGLHEAPVFRLSDTWFGPNTMTGELAYASRAFGRLNLARVVRRPYRATGAVKVRNHGSDALLIERLKTPCPLLSLYQDETGQLWTNTQVLERGPGSRSVHFEVEHAAPAQAPNARLIQGPREQVHRSVFQRAFSSFVD